jgi:hypothetical protein
MRTTRSSVGWRSGNPIQRCSIMSTVYGNLRHCFGSDHEKLVLFHEHLHVRLPWQLVRAPVGMRTRATR